MTVWCWAFLKKRPAGNDSPGSKSPNPRRRSSFQSLAKWIRVTSFASPRVAKKRNVFTLMGKIANWRRGSCKYSHGRWMYFPLVAFALSVDGISRKARRLASDVPRLSLIWRIHLRKCWKLRCRHHSFWSIPGSGRNVVWLSAESAALAVIKCLLLRQSVAPKPLFIC
jgi:hypothetical protein